MMENIRNLIFDLGNVILNIDTKLSEKAFAQYGMNDFEKLYTLASQNELFDRLEVGSITENEFYDEFRRVTGCKLDNKTLEQFVTAVPFHGNYNTVRHKQSHGRGSVISCTHKPSAATASAYHQLHSDEHSHSDGYGRRQ